MPPRHGLLPLLPAHKSGPRAAQIRLLPSSPPLCLGPALTSKCHPDGPPTPPLHRVTGHSSGGWPCPRRAAEVRELALAWCSPTAKGGEPTTSLPAPNLLIIIALYSWRLHPVPGLAQPSRPPPRTAVFSCLLLCSAYCHLSKNLCALKGGERDLKILTAINNPASPDSPLKAGMSACFKA